MFRLLGRSAPFLLAMLLAVGVQALVPVTLPIVPGESVATCFGGLQQPIVTGPPYPADPNGLVLGLIDTRLPPVPTNPVPVNDVNWFAPMFHNLLAPATDIWNATNLGQVFGLCLDNAPNPNIYVAATTMYGGFPTGPGGPGAVYRVDGTTGSICIIAQLPNFRPALGQLAFDPNSNHLLISNFEDGLVYSLSLTSTTGNPCQLGNWTTYDHGMLGRAAASMSTIADDGLTGTFTALGRRVWALCVQGNRLYYSVWWEDGSQANGAEGNEIWSVQLDANGDPQPATAIREAVVADFQAPSGYSNPVSDIEFNAAGEMLVAERTMPGNMGQVDLGNNAAHASRVLKFVGSSGSFTMLPDNTYRTGKLFTNTNAAGGVSSDCDNNVWAMVDAIHFGSATSDPDTLYGLQRILAAGNATDSTAAINSLVQGLGPGGTGFFKAQLGDVDYVRECAIVGEGEGEGPCETITDGHGDCVSDATGQSISYSFTLTNLSGVAAAWVLLTPQTPGVTITPNMINVAIPNGGSTNITVSITGATPGKPICFTVTMLDDSRKECCSDTICIENPCDCVVIPVDKQKIECDPATPGSYLYTFYLTNTSAFTLEHAYFYADSGGSITPNYIALGSLAPGNTAGPFSITISGATPGTEYCFTISLHDKELKECCAYKHCIDLPNCCKPDGTPPVITILGPTVVHCGEQPAYDVTAIDKCDGDVSYTLKKEGQVNWFVDGVYCVTVTASDTSGNVASVVFCVTVTGCGNGGGAVGKLSTADQNADKTVQLSELLRVIQFYNAGGLHCDSFTEDGYAPGAADPDDPGPHHSCDYIVPDWKIQLSELLRVVQLYNAGGYHDCVAGEDGLCVGK